MYLTVLIPVVDVRPLLAEPTYRDPHPGWPVPARRYSRRSAVHHRSSFVRGLGAVRPRRRGAIAPWLSESSYVDLRGQLRIGRSTEDFGDWRGSSRVAYRTFYSDGITGRVEVCFAFRDWPLEDSEGTARRMRKYALSAPAWMRGRGAQALRCATSGRSSRATCCTRRRSAVRAGTGRSTGTRRAGGSSRVRSRSSRRPVRERKTLTRTTTRTTSRTTSRARCCASAGSSRRGRASPPGA
ncbi:hypothetical protein ACFQV2_15020 [Actinokineospora soli]|uniref:Polyketide cyclase / dehydrase and lipid transport n=1 Tax=Actinokineospora soli TaxID=1048753 RepID=A0ABW2TQ37_9PSEU